MVVRAMVMFEIRLGTLSGISTLVMIWKGDAPVLCAISMIFGLTSRTELSTRRAINGNAAITNGTMDAAVPNALPIISLVNGATTTIRIRNGTERSRLIRIFRKCLSGAGKGMIPSLSPTASSTPNGRPIMSAIRISA